MSQKRYWFRRKTPDEGWGIAPGSLEGWIATLIFVIVDVGGVALLGLFMRNSTHAWILVAWAFAWLAAFLVLMFATCEPLR